MHIACKIREFNKTRIGYNSHRVKRWYPSRIFGKLPTVLKTKKRRRRTTGKQQQRQQQQRHHLYRFATGAKNNKFAHFTSPDAPTISTQHYIDRCYLHPSSHQHDYFFMWKSLEGPLLAQFFSKKTKIHKCTQTNVPRSHLWQLKMKNVKSYVPSLPDLPKKKVLRIS